MYKKFDQKLPDKHDFTGRFIVKSLLLSQNWTVFDNPDKYDMDIIAQKGDTINYFEVGYKVSWKETRFPWNTVVITSRKKKYMKEGSYSCVVNSPGSVILIVHYTDVLKSRSRYIPKDELVYDVPIKYFERYDLPKDLKQKRRIGGRI